MEHVSKEQLAAVHARERQAEEREAALAAEIEAARDREGALALDRLLSDPTEPIGYQPSEADQLENERRQLRALIEAARAYRRELILPVLAEQAEAIDLEAAEKDGKAAELDDQAAPLLAQLEAVWGCKVQPGTIHSEFGNVFLMSTRADFLRGQAAEDRKRANSVRRQGIQDAGQREGADVDAVVADLGANPMLINPAGYAVRDFIADERAKALESYRPKTRNDVELAFSVRFRLVWKEGRIVRSESSVWVVTESYPAAAAMSSNSMRPLVA